MKKKLTRIFEKAFQDLGFDPAYGEVIVSDRPDLGQFQCNGALACAKAAKKNPREIAQKIVAAVAPALLPASDGSLSLAGPGFINITLTDEFIAREVAAVSKDARYGIEKNSKPEKTVIDFGGPNVAKAMHVGHLRSSIIGDSLQRIFRFYGNTVVGDNHLGDWGSPMGMLILEVQAKNPSLPYFDAAFSGQYPAESPVTLADLEEMYPRAAARFKTDEKFKADVLRVTDELQKGRKGYKALWQHFVNVTVADLKRDYATMGITFDTWLGESFFEDKMPAMVESLKKGGFTEISQGALIIPLSESKSVANSDSEEEATPTEETAEGQAPGMPPLILVKSGGGFLYHTSDLATIQYRVDQEKADLILYVVDKRQSMHFKQVFTAASKTGLAKAAQLEHLGFGTMNGTDGKPFKTRSGGVLKLRDLIQMLNDEARSKLNELGVSKEYPVDEVQEIARLVGMATLKFADLKNNRVSDYVFDLKKFAQFEGFTGPYLLYAAVRIKSILRKAREAGLNPGAIVPAQVPTERNLMLEIVKLPDAFSRSITGREPHHLAQFGYDLSQSFNTFYKDCHILRETDSAKQASWLGLCQLVHDEIVFCLTMLGITVPERM
ncbi:MAG: arginine--tRNA ligase [Bdellovibrionales bacterium]|nr:arginine--tRNA ligase [Bdellovibrionales bacterium]